MLKPLENKAIVRIKQNEEITKSGILIVGNSEENLQFVEIIEVGKCSEKLKCEVEKGDIVIVNKKSGDKIKYQGEELIIINQNEILAIVK